MKLFAKNLTQVWSVYIIVTPIFILKSHILMWMCCIWMSFCIDAKYWHFVRSKYCVVTSFRSCSDMFRYWNIKCLVLTETHGFLMFEIGLMQLLSDNKADFTQLTTILALYFQIRNDYSSLCLQQVTFKLLIVDVKVVHAYKLVAIKVQVALIWSLTHSRSCH